MGPQETTDWDDLISGIQNRLETLERRQRQTAQDVSPICQDYQQFKDYVMGRFKNHEDIIGAKFDEHSRKFDVVQENFNIHEKKLLDLEGASTALASIVAEVQALLQRERDVGQRRGPEHFHISPNAQQPTQAAPQPGVSSNSAWVPFNQPHAPQGAEHQPVPETPKRVPQMPASFIGSAPNVVGLDDSPFDGQAAPAQSGCSPQYGNLTAWEISYKENKALTKFDAAISSYKDWAEEIFGHLNRTNRKWTQLLKWIQVQPTNKTTTPEFLMSDNVAGVNAWHISENLEAFLSG